MPNIGAFIAWGFITALFIPTGWWPNASLGQLVEPMLRYLLPLLIAMTAGRHVAGDRGGVIAAVAVMGVILGSDIPMFIGAMAIGPFAGWVIRSFDRWAEGRIPAGFEMLVNNFSVGILGIVCALIGFYAVGPVVSALTVFLSAGVSLMIEHGLLPLVAVFIEPAKVLFLNNAINHGIFSPIGIEQARQTGQSIMFLLETNPGPGLGVLLAYWAFARGAARSSAPGAIVIQFFGGIHEIYFPYVLMRPAIIVAPIVGSAAAILFYSLTGTGLTAVASPGSIIAVAAMAPKGETLLVLAGVVVAAAVSFFVAAPIVKRAHLEEVKPVQKPNGTVIGGTSRAPRALEGPIRTVVFACDAGMGSSAMGATRFRKRIEPLGSGVLTTAIKADLISPAARDAVYAHMATLNKKAGNAVRSAKNVHACTDVTGFGLLGHSYEMASGSGVTIRLHGATLPLMDEARDMAEMGIIPAGAYRNMDYVKPHLTVLPTAQQVFLDLAADPQTSGGLLVALPREDAEPLLRELQTFAPWSAIVGEVSELRATALEFD